ncbi:hypothetical protein AaE_014025, partial [Aphanomyces astaci]
MGEVGIMLQAMLTAIMEVGRYGVVQQPQQKFIRPVHGYMDIPTFKKCSRTGATCYTSITFEAPPAATLDVRLVMLVTLQWLASGVSVRSQEQLFQYHNHVTLAYYRQLDVRAIIKGLVDGGFYGSDRHEPIRVRSSCEAFRQEHQTFNKCLGALDGTHISIVVSAEMQDRFQNRKGQTSTHVLDVVDELGRFMAVFAGGEGCSSNSFIYSQTEFEGSVPSGYFYLGDPGYRLSK